MSNSLALAAVTAAFGRVVLQGLQAVPNLSAAPELRVGRPPMDPSFVGANLFLYRVTPNPARRNEDLATRGSDGALVRKPQVPLDLDFIISFYGSDTGLEPHRLMGNVVALLHGSPLLTPAVVRAALVDGGPNGILNGADLDRQLEPVRLVLAPLDIESLHRVWSLFYTVPYAMSVAYTASTVLLDADLVPHRPLPARIASFGASPTLGPSIDGVKPTVVAFAASATLTLIGKNLDASSARVTLGTFDARFTAGDGGLVVTIPPGLHAGSNSVRVTATDNGMGAEAGFVLAPHVADGAVWRMNSQNGGGIITLNLAPTPTLTQSAQLFLNPVQTVDTTAGPRTAATSASAPLCFGIDGLFAAELDRGEASAALAQAFAAQGVVLSATAIVSTRADGSWRLSDQDGLACRLERDGNRIAVYHGLAADYAEGTIAFQLRDIRPGRYAVSVQIGDDPTATSPIRQGALLFHLPVPADLDDDTVRSVVTAGFRDNGLNPSSRLVITRPVLGDGWQVRDDVQQQNYWVSPDGTTLAVYALDVAHGTFFGPAVTVPEATA